MNKKDKIEKLEDVQINKSQCCKKYDINNYGVDSMPECRNEWSEWCCFRSLLIGLIWTLILFKVFYVDIVLEYVPLISTWFINLW